MRYSLDGEVSFATAIMRKKAGLKAAITRKLNKQLAGCRSKHSRAAYKAHATRQLNAI